MNKSMAQIHKAINSDLAYRHSVNTNDYQNMQLVLRAYKYDYSYEKACDQVRFAQGITNKAWWD